MDGRYALGDAVEPLAALLGGDDLNVMAGCAKVRAQAEEERLHAATCQTRNDEGNPCAMGHVSVPRHQGARW
jgi:hypothetical protein